MSPTPPKPISQFLAWIDLETTGLSPFADRILEAALVITDADLNEIDALTYTLTHDTPPKMDQFVFDMHTRSGLLADLPNATMRLADVEGVFLERLNRLGEAPHSVPLCGSTVHFDRSFLRTDMPRLESFFSHRHVDVSSFKECAKRWNPLTYGIVDSEAHRALPDIRASISALRAIRETYWNSEIR